MRWSKLNALESAKRKLQVNDFDEINLPNVRKDISLWKDIQIECNLTLQELSALKNYKCKLERF